MCLSDVEKISSNRIDLDVDAIGTSEMQSGLIFWYRLSGHAAELIANVDSQIGHTQDLTHLTF